jgi:hypothetical protein
METGIAVFRLDGGEVDVAGLVGVELAVWRTVEEIVTKVVVVSVEIDSRIVFVTRDAGDVDSDTGARKVSVTRESGPVMWGA